MFLFLPCHYKMLKALYNHYDDISSVKNIDNDELPEITTLPPSLLSGINAAITTRSTPNDNKMNKNLIWLFIELFLEQRQHIHFWNHNSNSYKCILDEIQFYEKKTINVCTGNTKYNGFRIGVTENNNDNSNNNSNNNSNSNSNRTKKRKIISNSSNKKKKRINTGHQQQQQIQQEDQEINDNRDYYKKNILTSSTPTDVTNTMKSSPMITTTGTQHGNQSNQQNLMNNPFLFINHQPPLSFMTQSSQSYHHHHHHPAVVVAHNNFNTLSSSISPIRHAYSKPFRNLNHHNHNNIQVMNSQFYNHLHSNNYNYHLSNYPTTNHHLLPPSSSLPSLPSSSITLLQKIIQKQYKTIQSKSKQNQSPFVVLLQYVKNINEILMQKLNNELMELKEKNVMKNHDNEISTRDGKEENENYNVDDQVSDHDSDDIECNDVMNLSIMGVTESHNDYYENCRNNFDYKNRVSTTKSKIMLWKLLQLSLQALIDCNNDDRTV